MVAGFGQRTLPLYSKLLNNIPKKFTCLRGNLKTAVDALTLVMEAALTVDVGLVVPVCQSLILAPAPKVTSLCMEIIEEMLQCPPIHSLEVDSDTWESSHPKGSVVKTQSSPWRPEEGDYSSLEKLNRTYTEWDLPSVLVEKLVCPRPSSVKELLLSLVVVVGSECVDLPLLRRVCLTAQAYFFHMESVSCVGLLSVLDFLLRTASETRDSNVTAFLTQQMNSNLSFLFPLASLTKQVAPSESVALEVSTAVSGAMNAGDDVVGVDLKKLRKQVADALRRSNPTTRQGELLKSPSTSWREKRVTTFKAVVSEEAPAKRGSGRVKGAGCQRPELLRLAVEMAVVVCRNGSLPKQDVQIAGPKVHMLALELLWTVLHSYQCLHDSELIEFAETHLIPVLLNQFVDPSTRVHSLAFLILEETCSQLKRCKPEVVGHLCQEFLLPLLDSPVSPFAQKSATLDILENIFFRDPRLIHDIYELYDVSLCRPATGYRLVDTVAKMAQGRLDNHLLGCSTNQVMELRRKALEAVTLLVLSFSLWADAASRPSKPPVACTALRSRRRTKINYDQCLAVFESNPKKGIETLIARGYLMEDPDCVARFLRCRGLPKGAVGGYLGEHSEFCQSVMRIYISELHFEGMPINEAVRSLLQHFRLPAEAQKIERIVEQFASCYFEGRPESSPIHTSDCAFVLTFSLIMLHTDAHSREIRPESKMTKEQFIRNNGGINGSEDLPREYLSTLYDLITAEEWVMEEDATRRLRADVAVEASTSLAVALGFSQSTIGRRRQEVFLRETQQWIEAFANEVDSGLKSEEQGPLLSRGMHVDDLVARFEVVISELLWSVLPTHAYVLETSTCDTEEVLGVLGLRHVTHIACHYRISELCGAVVAALTKTAGLHVQSVTKVHMGTKEIRATIAVLECIRKDFAGIGPHWFAVLYSASEVERLLAAARYYDKNPRNLYTVESDSSPESAVRTPLESTAAHCQGDALNGIVLAQFLEKDAVDFRSFPLIKLSKASCRHFFLAFKKVAELHLARDPPHAWPLICLLEGSKTLSATQSEFFTSSLLPILDDLIRSVAVAEVSGFWAVEAWRDLVCSMLRNQSAPDVNDAFLCFNFLVNSSSVSFEHSCLSVKYFLAVIQTHWNVLQRHLPMVLRSLDASMSGFEKEVMRSPDYILARNYWANLLTATTFVIRHNEDGIAWAELVPLLGRIAAVSPWMAKKSEDVESLRCDTRCPLMAVATLTAIATSHVDPPRLTTDAILTSEDEQTLTGVRLLRWPRNPQLVHDVCSQLALVGLLEGVSVPIHSAALSSLSIVVQSNLGLITDDMWTELLSGSRGFCALLTRVVALADSAPARTPPRDCPLDPHVDSWEDALIRLGPLHLLETWLQAWTFFTCDEVKAGKGERSVEVLTLTAALVVPAALQGGYSHQVSDFILRRILETVRCLLVVSSDYGLSEGQWGLVRTCLEEVYSQLRPIELYRARKEISVVEFRESMVLVQSSLLLELMEILYVFLTSLKAETVPPVDVLCAVTYLSYHCFVDTYAFDADVEGRHRLKQMGYFRDVRSVPGLMKHERLCLKLYGAAMRHHVSLFARGSPSQTTIILLFVDFFGTVADNLLALEAVHPHEKDSAQLAMHVATIRDDILGDCMLSVISDDNLPHFAFDLYCVLTRLVKSTNSAVCTKVQEVLVSRFGPMIKQLTLSRDSQQAEQECPYDKLSRPPMTVPEDTSRLPSN